MLDTESVQAKPSGNRGCVYLSTCKALDTGTPGKTEVEDTGLLGRSKGKKATKVEIIKTPIQHQRGSGSSKCIFNRGNKRCPLEGLWHGVLNRAPRILESQAKTTKNKARNREKSSDSFTHPPPSPKDLNSKHQLPQRYRPGIKGVSLRGHGCPSTRRNLALKPKREPEVVRTRCYVSEHT